MSDGDGLGLVVAPLMALAGCSLIVSIRDSVPEAQVATAIEWCEPNDGLKRIEVDLLTPHNAICKNGAVFDLPMVND